MKHRLMVWLVKNAAEQLAYWLRIIADATETDATLLLNSDGSSYVRLHCPRSLVIREITLDAPVCLAHTLVDPKVFAAAFQDASVTLPRPTLGRRRTDIKVEPEDLLIVPHLHAENDPEGTQYFVDNRRDELLPVASWDEAKQVAARYPGNVAIASHQGITFRAFRPAPIQQMGEK